MKKETVGRMLNDPSIKLTEEWQQMVYKMYLAIFGNGESIFGQMKLIKEEIKSIKEEIKNQVDSVVARIQFMDNTIDNYIDTENDYRLKFIQSQQELEKARQDLIMQLDKTRTEKTWKFIILIGGLSGWTALIINLVTTYIIK